MRLNGALSFRVASEPWELEAIHRLNYRTFVEEIPQHEANESRVLVDPFHSENTYIVCARGREVLGMLAVRAKRPFSLDHKLEDLDAYLPPHNNACEIRLLAVLPDHRNGAVFRGLGRALLKYCRARGYDLAVISGTVRQLRLYRGLGFKPFGPLVGAPDALYQPMYITVDGFQARSAPFENSECALVNLLPGPVGVSERVLEAAGQQPVSHRSAEFALLFAGVKRRLLEITGARSVEILLGSGTLANDAVAGQISLLAGPGLILSNGEFGERLVDHARRFGLTFEAVAYPWGEPFQEPDVRAGLSRGARWLWAVHSETSTGMLNDLAMLQHACAEEGAKLCLDCVSSLGVVPVDLSGVYLAASASGKGLRALPGLAMVLYNHDLPEGTGSLPRYLDLRMYAAGDGIAYTQSSNLVMALDAALGELSERSGYEETARVAEWLRARLNALGLRVVGVAEQHSPGVVTIALPESLDSLALGEWLEARGFLLSYRSRYLLDRNWIQVCLMGEFSSEQLDPLIELLRERAVQSIPTAL